MNSGLLTGLRTIFSDIIDMIKGFDFPGTNVSIWSIMVGIFVCCICVKLLGIFMGLAPSTSAMGFAGTLSSNARNVYRISR